MESINQNLRDSDSQLLREVESTVKFSGARINDLAKNKYDLTFELDPPSSG